MFTATLVISVLSLTAAGSDQPMNGSPGSDDNDELLHSEDHHSGTTAGPSLERYTSPVSPTFATPPIRSAALKSMFPDELSKVRQAVSVHVHVFCLKRLSGICALCRCVCVFLLQP